MNSIGRVYIKTVRESQDLQVRTVLDETMTRVCDTQFADTWESSVFPVESFCNGGSTSAKQYFSSSTKVAKGQKSGGNMNDRVASPSKVDGCRRSD